MPLTATHLSYISFCLLFPFFPLSLCECQAKIYLTSQDTINSLLLKNNLSWLDSKLTQLYEKMNLTFVPFNFFVDTQVLEMGYNVLKVLPNDVFNITNYVNLQKLRMSNNNLELICPYAFRGIGNMVEIDFSNNSIGEILGEVFSFVPILEKLYLSDNHIVRIDPSLFRHLKELRTLHLSNNGLKFIENSTFLGLDHLEVLKLDGNQLSSIPGPPLFPKKLHTLKLEDNPWTCDCKLRPLHQYLLETIMPQDTPLVCASPARLEKREMKTLLDAELACTPIVSPKAVSLVIQEGENFTLECDAYGDPTVNTTWMFNPRNPPPAPLEKESNGTDQPATIQQGRRPRYSPELPPAIPFSYNIGMHNKTSSLFISNATSLHNGTFSCSATNNAGSDSALFAVNVLAKKDPPQVHLAIVPNGDITMTVALILIGITSIVLITFAATYGIRFMIKKWPARRSNNANPANGELGDLANRVGAIEDLPPAINQDPAFEPFPAEIIPPPPLFFNTVSTISGNVIDGPHLNTSSPKCYCYDTSKAEAPKSPPSSPLPTPPPPPLPPTAINLPFYSYPTKFGVPIWARTLHPCGTLPARKTTYCHSMARAPSPDTRRKNTTNELILEFQKNLRSNTEGYPPMATPVTYSPHITLKDSMQICENLNRSRSMASSLNMTRRSNAAAQTSNDIMEMGGFVGSRPTSVAVQVQTKKPTVLKPILKHGSTSNQGNPRKQHLSFSDIDTIVNFDDDDSTVL